MIAGLQLANAAESKPTFFDPYETVPLGRTKIKLSRFCLGTGMNGSSRQSNHTRMGKQKLEALLQGAYDRGIRVFDLADLYGTHPYLIPALKEIPRDKYAIITKVWLHTGGLPEPERPDVDVVVIRFLKEIGTDHSIWFCCTASLPPTGPMNCAAQWTVSRSLRTRALFEPTAFPATRSPPSKPLRPNHGWTLSMPASIPSE